MRPGTSAWTRSLTRLAVVTLFAVTTVAQDNDDFMGTVDAAPWPWETRKDELWHAQQAFLKELRQPIRNGMNVQAALEAWFKVKAADQAMAKEEKINILEAGQATIAAAEPLPRADWPDNPSGVELKFLESLSLPDYDDIACRIVEFEVDELTQYGVVLYPKRADKFPLILYLHGAAYGVPTHSLPWLAELSRTGYVIAAPALRGENLFASWYTRNPEYVCEGEIENLKGEVNDALAIVDGAYKLPQVKPGKFGIIGHSFGAGVGLLALARAGEQVACMVSYDAWFTNPFRYYLDRLSNDYNNWLSWEEYTELPIEEQLPGLMERSIVHNAEDIQAALLLFIGGGYSGIFHDTHEHLIGQLKKFKKNYTYKIVPDGGHNFVLYYDSSPALYAYGIQASWLDKYLPPARVPAAAEQDAPAEGAPQE